MKLKRKDAVVPPVELPPAIDADIARLKERDAALLTRVERAAVRTDQEGKSLNEALRRMLQGTTRGSIIRGAE